MREDEAGGMERSRWDRRVGEKSWHFQAEAKDQAGKRGRSRIKYFFISENNLKPFNDCRSQIIMPVKLSIVYLVR